MFKKTSKKNTQRRKSKAKTSKGALYFNDPKSVARQSQVPFTLDYSDFLTNQQAFKTAPVRHRLWGNGIRVSGRARLCGIGHYYYLGTGFTGAILNPPSNIYYVQTTGAMGFNPLGTHSLRLYNTTLSYVRYAYRSVRLVYVPRCASTQTGTVTIALYGDGGWSGKPTDYSITHDCLTEIEGAMSTSWRLPACSTVTYNGDETWFCNVNYENQAAAQLSHQYTLMAKTLDEVTASVTMGQLYMDYVIDFFQPTSIGVYVGMKTTPPNAMPSAGKETVETDSDPITVKLVKDPPDDPATGPGGPAEVGLKDAPDASARKPYPENKTPDPASSGRVYKPNRQ